MVIMTNMRAASQRGVVLFIALIVLVVMSLAGVAMNRSVENSLGIAGNLAFRKSTLQGTEKATANAIAWLDNNRAVLNRFGEVNAATTGYYFAPVKAKGSDDAFLEIPLIATATTATLPPADFNSNLPLHWYCASQPVPLAPAMPQVLSKCITKFPCKETTP